MNVHHHRRAVFCHDGWNWRQRGSGRVIKRQPLTSLGPVHSIRPAYEWLKVATERRMPL